MAFSSGCDISSVRELEVHEVHGFKAYSGWVGISRVRALEKEIRQDTESERLLCSYVP